MTEAHPTRSSSLDRGGELPASNAEQAAERHCRQRGDVTHRTNSTSESSVDKRARQFVDLVEESSAPLVNKGFSRSGAEILGAAGRRPYAVRVTFTRNELAVTSELTMAFAGDEYVSSTARRGDDVVFEASATAHKGQELRKALANHFEHALTKFGLD
jgi:hypothetical protein